MSPLIEEYLDYILVVKRYSPRTVEIYSDVLGHLEEYLAADGASIPEALTPQVLRRYEVHLLDNHSAKTVNLHLSSISGFCKFLVRKGSLQSNPIAVLKRPEVEKRLPFFYKEDAMKAYFERTADDVSEENLEILRAESDPKRRKELYRARLDRSVISLLFGTGIRRAELISLNIKSLDLSRHILNVRGKGDKMRGIPLMCSISHEILLYLQSVEAMVGRRRSPDEPLFVTATGNRLYPVFVDRLIKRAFGADSPSGMPGRKSPHVLRHTIATELLDRGADLYSIKEMLGHSSLAATQVYTHNSIAKLKNIYNQAHPRAKRGGKNDN